MAEKNNATCSICGNEYYVCLSCRDSAKVNPWKIHCCSSEHYKVYQIIHGLSTKVYNKDEARTKLNNVDLNDLKDFRPHIKKIIKDVLKEQVADVVENVNTAEELAVGNVDESAEVESVVVEEKLAVENIEVVKNVENIEKPIISRKRNYKVETE